MGESYSTMEQCARLAADTTTESLQALIELLGHPDWPVRYAAAIALGDRRDPAATAPLFVVLTAEDALPLYTQPTLPIDSTGTKVTFPPEANQAVRDGWARRWRLTQAAIVSLGQIGVSSPEIRESLMHKCVDKHEEYAVRAASCHALAILGDAGSIDTIRQATQDSEFCTRTEAIKALATLLAHA